MPTTGDPLAKSSHLDILLHHPHPIVGVKDGGHPRSIASEALSNPQGERRPVEVVAVHIAVAAARPRVHEVPGGMTARSTSPVTFGLLVIQVHTSAPLLLPISVPTQTIDQIPLTRACQNRHRQQALAIPHPKSGRVPFPPALSKIQPCPCLLATRRLPHQS